MILKKIFNNWGDAKREDREATAGEREEKLYNNQQESNIFVKLELPITNMLDEAYKNLELNNVDEAKNKYQKIMEIYKTLSKEDKAKVFKDCFELRMKLKESEEEGIEEKNEQTQEEGEKVKQEAEETDEEHLDRLSEYILRMLKKGFPKKMIEEKILSVGWSKEIVKKQMSQIKIPKLDTKPKTINTKKKNIPKRGGKTYNKSKKRGGKMPKKMTKEDAIYLLRGVESERCFWVNNGPVIGSLEGLQTSVQEMGEETFSYHVNKDKNDISAWVNEVVGDKTLARDLSKAKTKETFLKKIKARIASLKKIASK